MKKLLFLLLLPLSVLGQNTQIDLKLFNQDTNVIVDEQNSIEEGETIRMEVHMAAVGTADYDSLVNYKYLFLDIQYNHNILTPVTDGFAFTGIDVVLDAGPITAKYDFPNTSFSIIQGDLRDSHTKWKNGTATYSAQNAKWSVVRIAVQLSNKSLQDLLDPSTYLTVNSIFDMMFTIKPDSNLDAEQEFRLTLAHIEDTDGVMITNPIYATATDGREYYSVEEAVTYNAT